MSETDPTADDTGRSDEPTVACTLSGEAREQRNEWFETELLPHLEAVEELDDGYEMAFDGTREVIETVAEAVAKEAECCSFAHYRVDYGPPYDAVRLAVTGPDGTKALYEEAGVEAFDEALASG